MNWSPFSVTTSVGDPTNCAVKNKVANDDLIDARVRARIGGKYLLNADIAKYYYSIYTHSLPWILHSKAFAKSNRWNMTLLGNEIDRACRDSNDGQTIGIPVGPDTSAVLSEIIGSYIDFNLATRCKIKRGFRYIDDFEFGFKSYSEAELAAAEMQGILADIELSLNANKCKIIELPAPLEQDWVSHVRIDKFPFNAKGQRYHLIRDYDYAQQYLERNPDVYIMRYLLSKYSKSVINSANWDIFQRLAISAMAVDPSLIEDVSNILLAYKMAGRIILLTELEEALNSIILRHAPMRHENDLAWAIYAIMAFDLRLSFDAWRMIVDNAGPVASLVALDAYLNGSISSTVNVALPDWSAFYDKDNCWGESWMYAYETEYGAFSGTYPPVPLRDNLHFNLSQGGLRFYRRFQPNAYQPTKAITANYPAAQPAFSF